MSSFIPAFIIAIVFAVAVVSIVARTLTTPSFTIDGSSQPDIIYLKIEGKYVPYYRGKEGYYGDKTEHEI